MTFIYGLMLSFMSMMLAWVFYLKTSNPGLIDVVWGLNIAVIGSFYLLSSTNHRVYFLMQALLLLWSLRLSVYLYVTRIKPHKFDQRYEKISAAWKNKKRGFLYNYLFQGCLGWLVATPFYFVAGLAQLSFVQILAGFIIVLGIIGESFADMQLGQFKKSLSEGVCNRGLWGYSRHPNYFFECVVWFGFSLAGVSSAISCLSFIAVVTLFLTMWFLTIPLTEKQSLEHRGDHYKAYQTKVSCFLPWFN